MGKGSESTLQVDGSAPTNRAAPVSASSSVKSTCPNETLYTWNEVEQHCTKNDCWIVVNECVYDLTTFKRTHPGGPKLIDHFAGQDATVRGFFIYSEELFNPNPSVFSPKITY